MPPRTARFRVMSFALSSLVLVMAGCGGYGSVQSESRSVDAGAATSVRADVRMASGELTIHGGASALMNGDFTYNEKLKPEISYDVQNGQGRLVVKQPDRNISLNFGSTKNEWDIRLNDGVPIELNVDVSSGDSTLDLTSLPLTSLSIDSSSGNTRADLGGSQNDLVDVRIDSSSGRVDLTLDGDYEKLRTIDVNSSSGNVRVDLSGNWAGNVDGAIKASSGDITVRVPRDPGVIVNTSTSSGRVRANGFRINGDDYVNDAYGTSNVSLKLDISVSSGDITLELVD